jgi:imidazolonepropionase-like amidohydrolase
MAAENSYAGGLFFLFMKHISDQTEKVLSDVTLIDGTGQTASENMSIILKGNRIKAVGKKGKIKVPRDAEVIELHNNWVIPGLIDAHCHPFVTKAWTQKGSRLDLLEKADRCENALRQYLASGVTTIADAGGDEEEALRIRDTLAKGTEVAPRILLAIMITNKNGHGREFGAFSFGRVLDDSRSIDHHLDEAVKLNFDFVKLIIEPRIGEPFSYDQLKRILEGCHKRRLRVMTHNEILETHDVSILKLGPTATSHVPVDGTLTEEILNTYRGNRIYTIPTAFVLCFIGDFMQNPQRRFFEDDFHRRIVSPEVLKHYSPDVFWSTRDPLKDHREKMRKNVRKNIQLLHEHGAQFGVGSDAPMPGAFYGAGVHDEMQELVKCGLTPMEAIIAATRNNAELLGVINNRGTVEPGKFADLVVLSACPLEDITNTHEIQCVVKDGIFLDPEKILQMSH